MQGSLLHYARLTEHPGLTSGNLPALLMPCLPTVYPPMPIFPEPLSTMAAASVLATSGVPEIESMFYFVGWPSYYGRI